MIFKPFTSAIDPKAKPWVDRSTNKLPPCWSDFANDEVALPDALLQKIETLLKRDYLCILVGPKNTGKTWLSYAVGFRLTSADRKKVFFATVSKDFRADEALTEVRLADDEVYFILDNCQENRIECSLFLDRISADGDQRRRFLFNMWRTGTVVLFDDRASDAFGRQEKCKVELPDPHLSTNYISDVIERYIDVKNVMPRPKREEIADVARKWGDDLYWVRLRLESWKWSSSQRLIDVTDADVYETIWKGPVGLSDAKRLQVLQYLATFCQFEPLRVEVASASEHGGNETVAGLVAEGWVQKEAYKRIELLRISEGFADLVLQTIQNYRNPEDEDERQVGVFRDYLKRFPDLWRYVTGSLYVARNGSKGEAARKIVKSLLDNNETWTRVECEVPDSTPGEFLQIRQIVEWSKSVQTLRYPNSQRDAMLGRLRSATADSLCESARTLHQIPEVSDLTRALTPEDWRAIADRSTLASLYRALWSMRRFGQEFLARKLASAIPECDLGAVLSTPSACWRRLNGLLNELKAIDKSAAQRLLDRLVECNLAGLPGNTEQSGREFEKAELIAYFLSAVIPDFPESRRNLARGIKERDWTDWIISSNTDQAFFLLWNLHVIDPALAQRVATCGPFRQGILGFIRERGTALRPRSILSHLLAFVRLRSRDRAEAERQAVSFLLPMLGALCLCGYDTSEIELALPSPLVKTVLESFRRFDSEFRPTHLVLSLVGLRARLPREEFREKCRFCDDDFLLQISRSRHPDHEANKTLGDLAKELHSVAQMGPSA